MKQKSPCQGKRTTKYYNLIRNQLGFAEPKVKAGQWRDGSRQVFRAHIEDTQEIILGTQYLPDSSIGFWPGFLLPKATAQCPL